MSIPEQLSSHILNLRALVLALGEATAPPWWRSKFMGKTGCNFLERLYPRSAFSAALHAAGKAACEIHDRAIGRRGAFHLFRLPEGLEREVRAGEIADGEALKAMLGNIKGLQTRLQAIASAKVPQATGPYRIGDAQAALDKTAYQQMAALYLDAIRGGRQVFPYFEVGD